MIHAVEVEVNDYHLIAIMAIIRSRPKKALLVAILWAFVTGVWNVISAAGNLRTAWDVAKDFPSIFKWLAWLITTPWLPLAIVLICLAIWGYFELQQRLGASLRIDVRSRWSTPIFATVINRDPDYPKHVKRSTLYGIEKWGRKRRLHEASKFKDCPEPPFTIQPYRKVDQAYGGYIPFEQYKFLQAEIELENEQTFLSRKVKSPTPPKGNKKIAVTERDERQEGFTSALADRPAATFALRCDTSSWSMNTWAIGPVRFLHGCVSIAKSSIPNCKAYLIEIRKGQEVEWSGGPEQLTWSPHPSSDSLSKTLHQRIEYQLDVLVIRPDGEIQVCNHDRTWLRLPRLHHIFAEAGDYVLTIAIAGDGVHSEMFRVKFQWTKNWQTSFLTSLENGQRAGSQGTASPEPLQLPDTGNIREGRMQEAEVKRLSENWFRPRLHDRIAAFHKTVQRKLGEFAKRGWTASPHMYGAVEILAGEEIDLRGNILLEGYTKALTATAPAVTPKLQSQIQRNLDELITAESEQVWQSIQYVADACKVSMRKDAAVLRAPTIAKITADFDLLCARLNRERAARS